MLIAYVFPGQGSQYVGMGKKIAETYPEAKAIFSRANEVLKWDLEGLCFNGPVERLNQTAFTQPAILATSIAVFQVLNKVYPVMPQWVGGHSLGEYSALITAGGISFEDGISLVARRGELMQRAVPEGAGAMAAILGLDRSKVEQLCNEFRSFGIVTPANYNTPEQIVIAGEKKAVESVSQKAVDSGAKKVIPLAVSVPSHCPLMEPAARELEKEIEKISIHDLKIGLVNNVEAKELKKKEEIKASLVRQISSPLLWVDTILYLIKQGAETFVEVGPGRVLSGLIKRIDRRVEVLSVEDPETLDKTVSALKNR
ncbi:MAG: ACP S-malonyltransferase [Nitrospirae bacterium]|nr:ACP S-malonyltransferase [Nitrospirota bacterium]